MGTLRPFNLEVPRMLLVAPEIPNLRVLPAASESYTGPNVRSKYLVVKRLSASLAAPAGPPSRYHIVIADERHVWHVEAV